MYKRSFAFNNTIRSRCINIIIEKLYLSYAKCLELIQIDLSNPMWNNLNATYWNSVKCRRKESISWLNIE